MFRNLKKRLHEAILGNLRRPRRRSAPSINANWLEDRTLLSTAAVDKSRTLVAAALPSSNTPISQGDVLRIFREATFVVGQFNQTLLRSPTASESSGRRSRGCN